MSGLGRLVRAGKQCRGPLAALLQASSAWGSQELAAFGSQQQRHWLHAASAAAAPKFEQLVAATAHLPARVLDGRAVAVAWQEELAADVRDVVARGGRPPGLGVVLVGTRPDSQVYVSRKREACEKVGMFTEVRQLSASVTQQQLEAAVGALCADPRIDGVLVQLPLPPHINEEAVIDSFDPQKDVDGFHPLNMGRILMRGRDARFIPCTALGVIELLQRSGVAVKGKSVVVMGDSNIVGMPLAMLFRDEGAATVTVLHRTSYRELFTDSTSAERARERAAANACGPRIPGPVSAHAVGFTAASSSSSSRSSAAVEPAAPAQPHPYTVDYSSTLRDAYATPQQQQQAAAAAAQQQAESGRQPAVSDLPRITRTADILVVAVGYPHLVRKEWVKPGAVVIDVGINVVSGSGFGFGSGAEQQQQQQQQQQQTGSSGTAVGTPQQQQQQQPDEGAAGNPAGIREDGYPEEGPQLQQPFHVVGDVDFCDVAEVAAALTPVPGGVGPMTIAAVLHNTVQAARYNLGLEDYS